MPEKHPVFLIRKPRHSKRQREIASSFLFAMMMLYIIVSVPYASDGLGSGDICGDRATQASQLNDSKPGKGYWGSSGKRKNSCWCLDRIIWCCHQGVTK